MKEHKQTQSNDAVLSLVEVLLDLLQLLHLLVFEKNEVLPVEPGLQARYGALVDGILKFRTNMESRPLFSSRLFYRKSQ